ncbi:hypothetical protein [Pilibacter termitis]|uniref:hypothetical protein n=1 Tax=Pilibacter termitis TaxID=263852 RepID=UPI0013563081|nr:hypothetical protein [Pilibacter termitis]
MKSVAVSHVVHSLETKFQVALRTATQLLLLVARQRKAKRDEKNRKTSNLG